MTVRVGIGRDIHALHEGQDLVLAGVLLSAPRGFRTHSDGDVVCHALIDALAGAMAFGDLGVHFPEDDPETDDAASIGFLEEFSVVVAERGFVVENIDCLVTIREPYLRPHVYDMRLRLAGALGIDIDKVSIKSRSNDGFGPEGTGEAASAEVVVLLGEASP